MAKQLNVQMVFDADVSRAKQQVESLKMSLDKLASGQNLNLKKTPLNQSLSDSLTTVNKLKAVLNDAFNTNTGKLDLTAFTKGLKNAGLEVGNIKKDLLSLGPEGTSAFIQLSRSVQQADAPLVSLNKKMNSLFTTIKNTAKWQISSSILHGFMGAISTAYHYAQDLNESLNNIRIRTGQTTEEMAKFAQQANEAAKSLSTTTTAYTNAALIYYQQGLNDQQVKERTDITVKMANVTKDSAETVSQQLTSVWNNFDKTGQKLEYIADVMNALGAATASSTSEIATGLQKFSAVAETAGMSYEYAASALATITAVTRQSADTVGTGLRTVLARIESLNLGETLEDGVTLTKYTSALEKIGVSVLDMNGNLRNADDILNDMAASWDNLTRAQKMATAETVGGIRQYSTIMALMENWDFMQQNVEVAKGSGGTLERQADIYAESWEAARDRVKAAAQSIYADLLDDKFFITILNGVEKIITFVDDLIDSLGGLPGLLSTISTLVFSLFGDKIANKMTSMAQSISLLLPQGRKEVFNVKEQFATNAANVGIDTGTDRGQVQATSIENLNKLSNAINENISKFQEADQKYIQAARDSIEQGYQNLEVRARELDILKQQTAEIEQQIKDKTSPENQIEVGEALKNLQQRVKIESEDEKIRTDKIAGFNIGENTEIKEFRGFLKDISQDFGLSEESAQRFFARLSNSKNAGKSVKDLVDDIEGISPATKTATEQIGLMYRELIGKNGKMGKSGQGDFITTLQEGLQNLQSTSKNYKNNNINEELGWITELAEKSDGDVKKALLNYQKILEGNKQVNDSLDLLEEEVNKVSGALQNGNPFQNWSTNIVGIAQGISSFSMGINSAVGSINTLMNGIQSGNFTLSQLLSVFSSLSMSITMIVPQFAKLATTFSSVTASGLKSIIMHKAKTAELGKGAIAAIMATAANKDLSESDKKEAIAKALETAGIKNATIAHYAEIVAIKLKELALKKYLIIAFAVIAAVAVMITVFKKLHEAELQAHKDGAEQAEKHANALKEESDKNQELVDSYKEALASQDDTLDSKLKLEEAARKVAAAYDIENASILLQTKQYDKLTDAIEEARLAELKKLQSSQQSAKNTAEEVFADSIKSFGDSYNRNISNGRINTHIETGGTGLSKITSQAVDQLGLSNIIDFDSEKFFGSDLIARAENTGKGFQEIYEAYSQLRDLIAEMATDQGLEYTNDILYKNLSTWLKDHQEAYEGYVAAVEALEETNTSVAVEEAMFGADSPKDLKEFDEVFNKAVDNLIETGVEADKARELVRAFFSVSEDSTLQNLNDTYGVLEDITSKLENKKAGQEIADFINSSNEYNNRTILGLLNWDAVYDVETFKTAYENAKDYSGVLAEVANAQQKIAAAQEGLSSIKDTMTEADYQSLKDAFESIKDDTISFSDFLKKSADEQKAYFNQIISEQYARYIVGLEEQLKTTEELGKKASEWLETQGQDQKYSQAFQEIDAWDKASKAREAYQAGGSVNQILGTINAYNQAQNYNVDTTSIESTLQQIADSSGIPFEELIQIKDPEVLKQKIEGPLREAFQNSDINIDELLGLSSEEFEARKNEILAESTALASEYNEKKEQEAAATQENLEKLQEQLEIQKQLAQQAEAAGLGLDLDDWDDLTHHLQEVADESDILADSLKEDEEAAQDVAKALMRMNRGVEKLSKDFSTWNSILRNSAKDSQEYSEAVSDLREATSDLLDINEEFLSEDFLVSPENLDLFQQAAQGSGDAIDALRQAALEDIVLHLVLSDNSELTNDELWNRVQDLQSKLDAMGPLEVGTSLDLGGMEEGEAAFVDALNDLILSAQLTTDQVNVLLSGMGFTANYASEPQEITTTYPDVTTTHHIIKRLGTENIKRGDDTAEYEAFDEYTWTEVTPGDKAVGLFDAFAFETSEPGKTVVPKVNSIVKKPSGSMNNSSSRNPGGSGGKGGGGGGGGKTNYAKAQKVDKKTPERYKEINDELADLTRGLDSASKASDRLWGKDRLASMDKEKNLINQQTDALKRKKAEALDYYEKDKKALDDYLKTSWTGYHENENGPDTAITSSLTALGLGNLAFEYDADGSITNWEDIYGAIYKKYNDMQAYWADPNNWLGPTGGDAQSQYEKEKLKPFEEWINGLEKVDKQYQETTELIKDLNDELIDYTNQGQDLTYEMIEYALELKLVISDMDLERIEYYIDKLSEDFYSSGENLANYVEKIEVAERNLNAYGKAIDDLNTLYGLGEISQADYYKKLKDINSELYKEMGNLEELKKIMKEYYGETLEKGQEELQKYTDRLDHVNEMLDHYKEVMILLGKNRDYKMIGGFLEGIAKNSMNNYYASKTWYDTLSVQRKKLEQDLIEAEAKGENTDVIKKQLEDLIKAHEEAENDLLDKTEEAAEAYQAVWENAIESIQHDFEMLVTDGLGYDFLNSSLDRLESRQDEYLTKTNQLFEMNDLLRKLQADSDKTSNVAAKQRIANFSAEMEQLKNKNELSKLDLDIAKARYQQLLAQIALEEAQNAKSMVRLHRDSEGNYGYMYTADQDKVRAAEDELAKANNDLYNIVLNGTNEYSQKSLELAQQYQDDLAQLMEDAQKNGYFKEQEYYDKKAALLKQYYELVTAYAREYGTAYGWLGDPTVSATGTREAYTQQERNAILQSQDFSYYERMADEMENATENYEADVEVLKDENTGIASSLGTTEQAIAENVNRSNEWTKAIVGENGLVNAIGKELTEVLIGVDKYLDEHNKKLNETQEKYEGVARSIEEMIEAQAKYAGETELSAAGIRSLGDGTFEIITDEGYATGGYTGSWGSGGKLALLHEKELILNKQDTENLLMSVDILRRLSNALDLQAMSAGLASISSSTMINAGGSVLDQNVTIHAEFPNAVDHTEIEMAFDTLINRASQYAGR